MTGVAIEPYAGGDLDAVASVWLSAWRSTGLRVAGAVTLDELRERLPVEIERGWSVHVGRVDGRAVAFVALSDDQLVQLFVAPDAQNAGIGKVLLDFAKAQRPGGLHLWTAAESAAVRFYEREGFTRGAVTAHARFGHPIVRFDWRPKHSN